MKALEFIKEVRIEAKKIVWPERKEVISACFLVMAVTAFAGFLFFIIDSCVYKLIQLFLNF